LQVAGSRSTRITISGDGVVGEFRRVQCKRVSRHHSDILAGGKRDSRQGVVLDAAIGDVRPGAEVAFSFDLAAVSVRAGEKVERLGGINERTRIEFERERPIISDRCRIQDCPVLQVVGAGVDIAGVVGVDSID